MTLMELMVAVSILIVVILAVGMIFSSASKAVGTSQQMLDMLSNVRAVQWQLERDLAGLDKNAFLVIRSGTFTHNGVTRRCDLLTFFSHGSFPHRTGTNSSSTPFTDSGNSPYARITWGQLALESTGTPWNDLAVNQVNPLDLNQAPTGIKVNNGVVDASGMILGRNAMLLFPANHGTLVDINNGGTWLAAFQNDFNNGYLAIDYSRATGSPISGESNAHITRSRVDAAATTASQIASLMATITANRAAYLRYEADHFCFRHSAVRSPYDAPNVINGYFRMHPIALQSVSSFIVEWTDGSVYVANDIDIITGETIPATPTTTPPTPPDPRLGTTRWFGLGYSKAFGNTQSHVVDPFPRVADPGDTPRRDNYCAIFSYDVPQASWPTALRFRYHVEDPSGRLQGGRDFVQIVKLPTR